MGPNYTGGYQPSYNGYGAPKRTINVRLVAIIGVVVVILFVVLAIVGANASKNSIGTQSQHLSVQLTNLSTLTASATRQLQNDQLQSINAETAIITDGVQANLATLFPKKIDKSIQADEADTTDTTNLSNAVLAGTYDSTYQQVLQSKLEKLTALMSEMYTKSRVTATKNTLNTDYKNYEALLTNLNKITI